MKITKEIVETLDNEELLTQFSTKAKDIQEQIINNFGNVSEKEKELTAEWQLLKQELRKRLNSK